MESERKQLIIHLTQIRSILMELGYPQETILKFCIRDIFGIQENQEYVKNPQHYFEKSLQRLISSGHLTDILTRSDRALNELKTILDDELVDDNTNKICETKRNKDERKKNKKMLQKKKRRNRQKQKQNLNANQRDFSGFKLLSDSIFMNGFSFGDKLQCDKQILKDKIFQLEMLSQLAKMSNMGMYFQMKNHNL